VIAPASRLSNAQDTRMGGTLADSLSSNAVVKSFGAERREDERLANVVGKWLRRTRRTWMRHTYSGTGQLALLWLVRSAVTGTALWLWWRGLASAGGVTYVLTTYFVVHGYLRDIGQHVHQLQRAVNEMEELVRLFDEPLAIARTLRRTGCSTTTSTYASRRANAWAWWAARDRARRPS
jgi:ATP-binding cassette, subfamily B, bacterial